MYQLINWKKDGKFSTRLNSNVTVELTGEKETCVSHLEASHKLSAQCSTVVSITPIQNDAFEVTDADDVVTVYEIIEA